MNNDPFHSAILSSGPEESSFDLRQAWNVIREKAWLMVLLGLVGAFGGLYYLRSVPSFYLSQAVVQVDPQVKGAGFQDDAAADDMDSYLATMKSRSFLLHAVESNDLVSDPDFMPPSLDGKPHSVEEAANMLASVSEMEVRHGTRFLEIGVRHKNPAVAQKLANLLATELMKQDIRQRAASSQMVIEFLLQKEEELKDQLQKSEEKAEDYVESHNAISLKERQDTVVLNLKSETGELMGARADRMRLEADDEAVKKFAGQPDVLLKISSVAENSLIYTSRQQIEDIKSKIVTMKLRYTEKHPKMIQARSELAEAEAALSRNLTLVPDLIHSAYESALVKEAKFEAAQKEREKMAMDLNKQAIEYNPLSRNVEKNQALYDSIIKRLGEAEVAKGIEVSPVHIFEAALFPTQPLKPNIAEIMAVAIGGGLGLAVATAFGLNALDSSLKTVEQAEQVTSLPVAAAIPRANRRSAKNGSILDREPDSPVAESFRSLRAFLYLAGRRKGNKTVLFTSAVPGEGKTFCAINCAVSLAQQGLRTILIDADLRAPMVGTILMPEENPPGITDWLEGKTDIKGAIYISQIDNLSVIAGGEIASNPAELLASPAFGELIAELALSFDCIVIDSAPVLPVSDTLLLVEHAQSVCLVTQAGKTPRSSILRASKMLAEAGAKPAGLLLNQLVPRPGLGQYPYGRKYGSRGNYVPRYGSPRALPLPEPANGAGPMNGASNGNGVGRG